MDRLGKGNDHKLIFKFLDDQPFQEMILIQCLKEMGNELGLESLKYFCKDLYTLKEFYEMRINRSTNEDHTSVTTEIHINARGALFDLFLRKYNMFLDEAVNKRPDGILNKIAIDKLEITFDEALANLELFDAETVELIYERSQKDNINVLQKFIELDLDRNFFEEVKNNPNKDLDEEFNVILSDMELQDKILRYVLADIATHFRNPKNYSIAAKNYKEFIEKVYDEYDSDEPYTDDPEEMQPYEFLFYSFVEILAEHIFNFESMDELLKRSNMRERLINILSMLLKEGEYNKAENIMGVKMLSGILFE